jgi:hypothetical protein
LWCSTKPKNKEPLLTFPKFQTLEKLKTAPKWPLILIPEKENICQCTGFGFIPLKKIGPYAIGLFVVHIFS